MIQVTLLIKGNNYTLVLIKNNFSKVIKNNFESYQHAENYGNKVALNNNTILTQQIIS